MGVGFPFGVMGMFVLDRSSTVFSSGHIWIWELDYKENWAPKNWCFWTVVLEKTLESPLDSKEIQPVHPKGNQSWIFKGRTDAEAETPILRPPDEKNWLTGKDPDAEKGWRQEEKGMTEDAMVGWHHWLNGHEFEKAPGVSDGQGGLAYCSPWGCKESDMTECEPQHSLLRIWSQMLLSQNMNVLEWGQGTIASHWGFFYTALEGLMLKLKL